MPLSSAETSVFSQVSTTPYWSSAVSCRLPSGSRYLQQPLEEIGEPVALLHIADNSSVVVAYQWGTISSISEAQQLLVGTLSDIQSGLGLAPSTVAVEDIRALRKWSYFPYFPTEALQKDIYGAYNKLQGDHATFFASGLNGFETVEFAIRAGKDLVASFF